ncbi:MAG: sulfatase [Deltaproteobacteria bacterium]|nr:sulfatase [Deltaproteobacteria bacterium]
MFLLLAACASVTGSHPPNILWVSMDTVGAEHMALYGGRAGLPALDALGGRVYEHAYTHYPETAVSHWTMFTGAWPELHGNVPRNGTSSYAGPTLGELLAPRGYARGAFIGGMTLRNKSSGLGRGFATYNEAFGGEQRSAHEVSTAAAAWIDEQSGPWFAFVHYFDAHYPYTPRDLRTYDPGYTGRFDGTDGTLRPHRDRGVPMAPRDLQHVESLYDTEIAELDEPLRELFGRVDRQDIVVVTSDHGESFGHGYLFNHRGSLHEEVLHVPLVVRAPGIEAGRDKRLTGLTDILPTVLGLLSIPVPEGVGGRDLRGPSQAALAAITDPFVTPSLFSIRDERARATWPLDPAGEPTYYDLLADPGELAPVAPIAELSAAREQYLAAVGGLAHLVRDASALKDVREDVAEQLELLGYAVPAAKQDSPRHPPPPPGGTPAPR